MTSTFYPPFHIGGDAVHVRYLAEELTKMGHEIHVIHDVDAYHLKRGRRKPQGTKGQVNTYAIESKLGRISPVLTYLTGSNKIAERTLERLIKDENPDWVHHHNISLLGGRIMNMGNARRIYTAHDYWLLCQRSDFLRNGKGLCQDRKCLPCSLRSYKPYQLWRGQTFEHSIDRLDWIIAPSRFISSIMEHHLRKNPVVIPNFAPRSLILLHKGRETILHLRLGIGEVQGPASSSGSLLKGGLGIGPPRRRNGNSGATR